jgi:hypothetical protein
VVQCACQRVAERKCGGAARSRKARRNDCHSRKRGCLPRVAKLRASRRTLRVGLGLDDRPSTSRQRFVPESYAVRARIGLRNLAFALEYGIWWRAAFVPAHCNVRPLGNCAALGKSWPMSQRVIRVTFGSGA